MNLEQMDFYYRKCREYYSSVEDAEKLFSRIMNLLDECPEWADRSFTELLKILDSGDNNYTFGYAKIKDGFNGHIKIVRCVYCFGKVLIYPHSSSSYITLAENIPNYTMQLKRIVETKTAFISWEV